MGRTIGLDFYLVVVVPHGLTDEGKAEYRHRWVERQARHLADGSGEPVLGVDRRPEVGGNSSTGDDEDRREHGDQQFAHPYILAQGLGKLLESADLLVAR